MPEYKVVSFVGNIKSGEGAQLASKQLEDVINTQAKQGWTFDSLGQINILVQPGCLAAFLGAKASTIVFDQVIFRK